MLCKTCGARILWSKTARGRPIPLDEEPVKGGNIRIENGTALYVKPEPEVERFVSHFSSCPQRAQHRRPA